MSCSTSVNGSLLGCKESPKTNSQELPTRYHRFFFHLGLDSGSDGSGMSELERVPSSRRLPKSFDDGATHLRVAVRQAEDARVLDNTNLSPKEQLEIALKWAKEKEVV